MNNQGKDEPGNNRANRDQAAHGLFRSVKSVITAVATSGRNKISQGNIRFSLSAKSEFHRGQILDMRGLALAIERDNESKPDSHFRCRDRDDEKHQHLTVQFVVEP